MKCRIRQAGRGSEAWCWLRPRAALFLKSAVASIIGLLAASGAPAVAGDGRGAESIRVLFVGNSYTSTNGMPAMVSAMSRVFRGGIRIETGAVLRPGATLEDHWSAGAVRNALRERTWDVVVLQEQSTRPMDDPERLLRFGRLLGREIRASGARTMLFLTWPRKSRPESIGALEAGYRALARELDADIVPVGPAWLAAMRRSPSMALYQEDDSHPSRLGSYLTACVFYLAMQQGERRCPNMQDDPLSAEEVELAALAATDALDAERKRAPIRPAGQVPGGARRGGFPRRVTTAEFGAAIRRRYRRPWAG